MKFKNNMKFKNDSEKKLQRKKITVKLAEIAISYNTNTCQTFDSLFSKT